MKNLSPPSPHFNDEKKKRVLVCARIHHWYGGRGVLFLILFCPRLNLGQNKGRKKLVVAFWVNKMINFGLCDIFNNTFNLNALSENLVTKISDHFPQFLIIADLKVNYASLNYYKHDYSHFSKEAFGDEVSHLDFSPIYNNNLSTNGTFDHFYDQIDSVCRTHVPYKRLSKKEVKRSSKTLDY